MVRCVTKRKRGFPSSATKNINCNLSSEDAASAVRIRCDSPVNGDVYDAYNKVCTIQDDVVPTSRQSSLLSFFSKERKVKQRHKTKKTNENSASGDIFQAAKTNTFGSLITLPTLSSSEEKSTERKALRCKSISHPHQKKLKSLTQVYIDCGQSKFGQVLCNKCGMLYMPGITEDENEHKKICQAYALGIPCNRGIVKGAKRLDRKCNDGATILSWKACVKAKRSKKSKMEQIETESTDKNLPSQWPLLAKMISKDLGTDEGTTLDHLTNESVFLYIGKNERHGTIETAGTASISSANKFRILGVATMQLLGQIEAYRMISLYERSLEPVAGIKMGIGLLWTHPSARNRGIATKLVDAVREHSIFGIRVARQDVAFSNPTQSGYNFALRYSNEDNKETLGTDNCHNKHDVNVGGISTEKRHHKKGPLVFEMKL